MVKKILVDVVNDIQMLFQSMPKVVLVFSQSTANSFISSLKNNFITGNPQVNEPIEDLPDEVVVETEDELDDGFKATTREEIDNLTVRISTNNIRNTNRE